MPAVPLGLKSYKRAAGFEPEVRLVNLLLEPDDSGASPDSVMRVQRPGLVQASDLGLPISALYQADNVLGGSLYAVASGKLWRPLPTLSLVVALAGTGPAVMVGRSGTLFILTGTTLQAWDGTLLSTIPIPDGYTPIDIETINSYLIIACSTGRFYWLEPGSLTVNALNFATAESSPDGLVGVRRLVDELFFFGTQSVEPWQPSGDLNAPFQKAGGRQYERGCLARDTIRRFDNALLWVGENCIVYRVGSVPTRVSDHGIEERLRKRTGLPSAWTLAADGHLLYVLNIPGQGTFAFDAASSAWSELATPGVDGWTARRGLAVGDTSYAADMVTGALWRVDPESALDGVTAFPKLVTGTVPLQSRGPRNDSFTVGIGSSADCTVKVRWRDGVEDFPAYSDDVPLTASRGFVNLYRLGQLREPSRTFEVRVDDAVRVRISGAMANEAWQ